MALQKQQYPIIFNQGVDTKTDEKIVQGKMLEANNVVFPAGTPNKRLGYLSFSNNITNNGGTITEGSAISTFKDELLSFGNTKLRSYAEPTNEWIEKGNFVPISVTQDTIIRNDNSQFDADTVTHNGLRITVWNEFSANTSINQVKYSVYTEESETYYVTGGLVDAEGKHPRISVVENNIIIVYQDTSSGNTAQIKSKYIESGNPLVLKQASNNVVATNSNTDGAISFITIFDKGLLAYRHSGDSIIRIIRLDNDGGKDAGLTTVTTGITTSGFFNLQDTGLASQKRVFIIGLSNTNVLEYQSYTNRITSPTSKFTIDTNATIKTIVSISNDNNTINVYYDKIPADFSKSTLHKAVILATGVSTATSLVKNNLLINSKPFRHNEIDYLMCQHISALQPIHFLIEAQTGCIVGTMNSSTAGTRSSASYPNVTSVISSNGKIIVPLSVRNRIVSEANIIYTTQGLTETVIDFNNYNYAADQLADNLIIGGGQLYSYDGDKIVENGFHLYPEGITTNGTLGSGYNYLFLYSWTDNQGNIYKSYPSDVLGITTGTTTLTIPTLSLTEKKDVKIEVYRTNGVSFTVFRLVKNLDNTESSAGSGIITWTDDVSNTSQATGALIYSNPTSATAIVPNDPPPSASIVKAHKNRIFLAGLANPNKIIYSKLTGDGSPVGFSLDGAFSIDIEPSGGDISALESLDDWLIVFKRDDIYLVSGQGPDNQGLRNTFKLPRQLASDVGCISQNSVVVMPHGIMFQSAKGIYLLSREQKVIYIGADVQKFNNETITSATLLDDANEVRFTTATGNTLVYNYFYNLWTTFDSLPAIDADNWKGSFVYIRSNGQVLRETPAYYKDNGTNVSMTLATQWIKLNGISGFQRLYRINFVGEWKSEHALKITLKYDYSDYLNDTYYYYPDSQFTDRFTTDENFSAVELFNNGNTGTYDFTLYPSKQKCEAVQIIIEDLVDSTVVSGGESFNLTAGTLELGLKTGLFKNRANKRIS